jgi:23S rRNA pseudouridine1911/1915/1917 synthase
MRQAEKMRVSLHYKLVFEDDSILIVDKPQGMATTPGRRDHLCGQVFTDFPSLSRVKGHRKGEGGLLNRLDNETGGLVFFAKTDAAFAYYALQMKGEKILKYYTAVVEGKPKQAGGVVDFPLAHHAKDKKRMVAAGSSSRHRGRPQRASTEWRFVRDDLRGSVILAVIKKGVRHQIRVHLAHAGIPIVGDKLYNKKPAGHEYHLLYATGVEFLAMEGKVVKVTIQAPFLAGKP